MIDREKVLKGLETCYCPPAKCEDCPYNDIENCNDALCLDALALIKEHKNEYENGFNDAMLGKQEMMYEGTDGKWHKKDW